MDGSLNLLRAAQDDLALIKSRPVKRLIDLGGALLVFVIFSPLLAVIAVAIYIEDGGPIFFIQSRAGLNGEPFRIIKFRTMYVSSSDTHQATSSDPRITRVGRYLRRWSFDELPQVFNVIRGEMSLVGPRPHPIWLDEIWLPELPDYQKRYSVKPGITGLAQVNGCRGETAEPKAMHSRLLYDLRYVNHCSITVDLIILMRTIALIWQETNIY